MGFIEFLVLAVAVCVIAAVGSWALNTFAPGHPPIINTIIWGVAVFIIIVVLVQAVGLMRHDVKIPSL